MEPLKIPRASNTKLTSNADINYDTLLAMANQTLDTPMAPPVDQDQLDSASGMRDLGSLAAALSGAVRGAGSVGGKLPNDFGFDQIARDMGNSRSVDLQNRMALRKQQENDMLEAIKNTGIAEQARVNKERRLKSVTPADRAIINAQLKKLFPDMDLSLPDEMTYGEIEDQPVLAQSLGMGGDRGGSSGLSFGDRMALENAKMGFQGEQNAATRGIAQAKIDDQGKRTQAILDEKEAEKQITHLLLEQQVFAEKAKQKEQKKKDSSKRKEKVKKLNEVKQDVLNQVRGIDNSLIALAEARKLKAKLNTGPFDSRLANLWDKARNKKNSDIQKLETILGTDTANYLLSVSGKSATDKEREFLQNNRPQINMTDGEFETKLDMAEQILKSMRNRIQVEQESLGKGLPPPPRSSVIPGITPDDPKEYGEIFADGPFDFTETKEQKEAKPTAPPKTGTEVPGNENIPKEALDKATDNYNKLGAIPYTPKPGAKPETKLDAKDQKLYDWAQKNPNDPRAQKVMKVIQNKIGTK